MIKKYFILKDFIGYPLTIISGDYVHGILTAGDFRCPRKLNNKFKGHDSLEEIMQFKMCNCGKSDCKVNLELKRIVSELIKSKPVNA